MFTTQNPQSRGYARTTGVLYLTIAAAGAYAIAYVPSQIIVPGDPAASLSAIAAHRGLFLSGILGDVVVIMAEIAATTMLYFMFKPVNATLSLMAAFARLSMAAVMAMMLFFQAGLLALLNPGSGLSEIPSEITTALAGNLIAMHGAGVAIWQVFFTLHLLILGHLIARSNLYPRLLGHALSLGGMGYLVDSIVSLNITTSPIPGYLQIALLSLVTLAEISFALMLTFRGPRHPE
jgi:hypothetical protein